MAVLLVSALSHPEPLLVSHFVRDRVIKFEMHVVGKSCTEEAKLNKSFYNHQVTRIDYRGTLVHQPLYKFQLPT